MEAHESALRSIALTADGSKIATASVKGTVIRVWDVQSATCLQEFRRGVERATITCMAWSRDDAWLACTSDKGTAHVFQVAPDTPDEKKSEYSSASRSSSTAAAASASASGAGSSLTRMFFSTVRKSVEGDAKKSVCQVRGVPHPHACAFVADAAKILAVAGWDADGNGVLLLSEFEAGAEPRRVGYHVLCKSAVADASEEARRRRRMRGWTPEIPPTPEGGRLYVGERLEVLERGMEQIHFEDKDEFVSVTAVRPQPAAPDKSDAMSKDPPASSGAPPSADDQVGSEGDSSLSQNDDEAAGRSNLASTVGDSVRTEPLDDDCDFSDHNQ
jgi:WD domain, G-beta repeat